MCCRKEDPFQGPKLGSCLTLGDELLEETRTDKARDFIGKEHLSGEQQGKGTQENCSAAWLAVSGFMVMGLVSGLSLANHSNSESFLVAHALLSQDGCQQEGFWEVDGPAVSAFNLSRTLPVGGGLLVPYSLSGSRNNCHKTTHANGYYGAWPGWAISVSVFSLTEPSSFHFCFLICKMRCL